MKKTIQISLSQTLFTVEEDAYAKLDQYLKSINAHFQNADGKDEIVSDIENRIAEQLSETRKNIITSAEVEAVILSMGQVEDFDLSGSESEDTGSRNSSSSDTYQAHRAHRTGSSEQQYGKKLYRNPDDSIIAGVCGGLAAYLGVDAVWVRISFIILTFITGFGILAYIIFWLLTPEAVTASQKLEMSGSPVNIETLSNSIKDKAEEIRKNHGSQLYRIASVPFDVLKKVAIQVKRVLSPAIRWIFGLGVAFFAGAALLAASFIAPLLLTNPTTRFTDLPLAEIASQSTLFLIVVAGYLAIAIPLALIFAFGISVIKRKPVISGMFGFSLSALWAISVIAFGVAMFKVGASYEEFAQTNPAYQQTERTIQIRNTTGASSTIPVAVQSLSAQSGIWIELMQGTTTSLTAHGNEKSIARVSASVNTEGVLEIRRLPSEQGFCLFCSDKGTPRLTLTTPSLSVIKLENGSHITAKEWKALAPLSIEADNGARIEMEIEADELNAEADNGARIELIGKATTATLKARQGSRIETFDLVTVRTDAMAGNGSRIMSGITSVLNATSTQGSRIEYLYTNASSTEVTEYKNNGGSIEASNDRDGNISDGH